MTAAQRLLQLAGAASGVASALLIAISQGGATAGERLVSASGLPSGSAAEHLLAERSRNGTGNALLGVGATGAGAVAAVGNGGASFSLIASGAAQALAAGSSACALGLEGAGSARALVAGEAAAFLGLQSASAGVVPVRGHGGSALGVGSSASGSASTRATPLRFRVVDRCDTSVWQRDASAQATVAIDYGAMACGAVDASVLQIALDDGAAAVAAVRDTSEGQQYVAFFTGLR